MKPAAAATPAAVGAPKPTAPVPQVKPSVPVRVASAAPVAKTAKAAQPIPAEAVSEVADASAGSVVDAPVAPKKKPVALMAAAAAVVVLGGLGTVLFTRGAKEGVKVEAAPVVATVSPEELQRQEQQQAQWIAEELASPRSFQNANYGFEVSDRGYLRKLTDKGKRVLIDEFGWVELVGKNPDSGKSFTSVSMSDSTFTPTVTKKVREGKVVFEVKGEHSRFAVSSLITCLPTSLHIETTFTPNRMSSQRGVLSLVYSVKMNRAALALGQRGVLAPGSASFATQSGAVAVKFDPAVWGPIGEAGKQSVTIGGNLILFEFSGGDETKKSVLNADLVLP